MSTTPGTRPSSLAIVGWLVLAALVIAAIVLIVLNGPAIWNSFFPPQAKSVEGQEIRNLYDIVFAFAVVIFFVVEGLIVWSVIRYRRKPGDDELPPQTHGNNLAEVTWTLIPTIIVIFLFVVSWQTLNSVEATSPAGPQGPRGRRPVPVVVRLPAGRRQGRHEAAFTITAAERPGRRR